jgi:hypothetical protein
VTALRPKPAAATCLGRTDLATAPGKKAAKRSEWAALTAIAPGGVPASSVLANANRGVRRSVVPTPAAASSLCHVSDHAAEVDRTLEFASRGVDAAAIESATGWPCETVIGAWPRLRVRRVYIPKKGSKTGVTAALPGGMIAFVAELGAGLGVAPRLPHEGIGLRRCELSSGPSALLTVVLRTARG